MRYLSLIFIFALASCHDIISPAPCPTVTVTAQPEPAPTVTVTAAPEPSPVYEMKDLSSVVKALDLNLLHSNCAEFLKQAVAAVRAQDPTWGFCQKSSKIPADILMYGPGGKLVDFVRDSCSPTSSVTWSVIDPNPDCHWSAVADPKLPIY